MNKPSWDDAPDWANWLAMDDSGVWYWYELEPAWDDGVWEYEGAVMVAIEEFEAVNTLEPRP